MRHSLRQRARANRSSLQQAEPSFTDADMDELADLDDLEALEMDSTPNPLATAEAQAAKCVPVSLAGCLDEPS